MDGPVTHLHIASTTGLVHWALIAHATAGGVGLVSGFLALAVAKGGRVHKAAGMVFVGAMVAMGLLATGIAFYEGRPISAGVGGLGGLFAAYLIFTAMTTVRPVAIDGRALGLVLAVFALAYGVATIAAGIEVMSGQRSGQGVPFGMMFFLGAIAVAAGAGDLRMIRAGGFQGARRLARHLWRMCFGLFVASGSFFLGQMRFFPKPLRIPGLLFVPAVLPLVALLYWLWRVRVRQQLSGIITTGGVMSRTKALAELPPPATETT